LKKLTQNDFSNQKKQLAIDQYLDQSCNGAYLNGEVIALLSDFFKQKDTVLYELIAFCIMHYHVHLLVKPLDNLARMMKVIKGGSAKLINEQMGRKGSFWFADYYDKLIRDDKHFSVVKEGLKSLLRVICTVNVTN
jgi:REP element-mobilizing transposase RayT